MAIAEDELILRVRQLGIFETEAAVGSLRREVGLFGRASMAAGERARVGFGMFGRGIGGIAMAVGISGVVTGVRDLVHAGIQYQEQTNMLHAALKNIGVTSEQTFNQVNQASEQLSMHGGFIRPEELTSITNFISQLHNVRKAEEANNAAVIIARQYHLQWGQAQMAVARALAGNTTRLAQYLGFIPQVKNAEAALTAQHQQEILSLQEQYRGYGTLGHAMLRMAEIRLREQWATQQGAQVTDKAMTAQEILRMTLEKFPHTMSAYNNSVQGMANNVRNSFGILAGQIGQAFLPEVKLALAGARGLFDFLDSNRWILAAIGGVLGLKGVIVGLKYMALGLRFVAAATREQVTSLFGLRTAYMALRGGTAAAAEQEQVQGMVISELNTKMPAQMEALAGMSREQLQAAATAERLSAALTEQAALAGRWGAKLTAATAETSAGIDGLSGQLALFDVAEETTVASTTLLASTIGILTGVLAATGWFALFMALGVAMELVMTHWKTIEAAMMTGWHWIEGAAMDAWTWIKGHWELLGVILLGPFAPLLFVVKEIVDHLKWIENAAKNIGHFFGGVGNFIFGGSSAVSRQRFASARGRFAGGGLVPRYLDDGGPSGTDTVPAWLSPGEYVLNSALTQQIGVPQLNSWTSGGFGAGPQQIHIQPGPVVLNLDGRTIARSVVRYAVERAARGPSSLVGGSLTTGVGGPTGVFD